MSPNLWLTHLEEKIIKAQFQQLIDETNQIDVGIIPILKRLNSLDGLVTLYSCKGTPANNNYSYLVLRSTEEMAYFLEEAIWDIREIEPDLSIDWNESVMYNILGKQKNLSCIILSSIESHTFMETLANCLDV